MKTRAFVLAAALLAGASAARPQGLAIEGATIVGDGGRRLEGATLWVENGKIGSIGDSVAIPSGARRIDGKGTVVTAGLADAWTTLGLVEIDLVAPTVEGDFKPDASGGIHAAYRVIDGYNPASVAIPIARAGGVTAVVAAPRGGLVSGTSAFLRLADGATVERATIAAPLAMHVTLGEHSLAAVEGSRGRAIERLRELLDDAAQLAARRESFERNQTRPFAASRLDLEALKPVLDGRIPLAVSVHRASDIRAALALAREHRVRLVIVGGTEAWLVGEELAKARVPVIVNPAKNLPSSFEQLNVRDDVATLLRKQGVDVALCTCGEQTNVRTLRQVAGIAVSFGMKWEDALAAITSVPTAIFGLKERGTLAAGAAADLVVWSGDPLELSSRPLHVFIDGVEQPLKTRQTLLLDRYR